MSKKKKKSLSLDDKRQIESAADQGMSRPVPTDASMDQDAALISRR